MIEQKNNINTVPFSGELLDQHRAWMRIMSEGELTPASSVNRKGEAPQSASREAQKIISSRPS